MHWGLVYSADGLKVRISIKNRDRSRCSGVHEIPGIELMVRIATKKGGQSRYNRGVTPEKAESERRICRDAAVLSDQF